MLCWQWLEAFGLPTHPPAGPRSISPSRAECPPFALRVEKREQGRRLAFSAKTWLPESWVRCKNSRCRDPNSARMLLPPATAQPQLLLEPLKDRSSLGHPLPAELAPLPHCQALH